MLFALGLAIGAAIGLSVSMLIARARHRKYIELERRAQQNERLAELGTLTGGLAHEIKNPLSTMQLNLQLLLEDIQPDDPLHGRFANRIASIQREASRLREILDDFLRYAGKIELQPQEVELNSLLEDLVDFLSPQAQLNRVQIRLRRCGNEVKAKIDPRLIKQAILNLMLNGLQAMADGGGDPKARKRNRAMGGGGRSGKGHVRDPGNSGRAKRRRNAIQGRIRAGMSRPRHLGAGMVNFP